MNKKINGAYIFGGMFILFSLTTALFNGKTLQFGLVQFFSLFLGLMIIYLAIKQKKEFLPKFLNRNVLFPHPLSQKINEKPSFLWVGWMVIGIIGITLLFLHIRLIIYPYQMEYREGAIVLNTEGLLKGINPWAMENNPVYTNVYGFVYNFLVVPFAWVFGNKVWIYRLLSFLSICGQIGLLILVLRKKKIPWIWVAFSSAFLWLGQFASVTSLARPDALGELFFLLTLFLPFLDEYKGKSLILSVLFGVLGFYTKLYFVLGIPIIATYLFLFVSKKKAFFYAVGFLFALVVSGLWVNRTFESYVLNVILATQEEFSAQRMEWLTRQNGMFVQNFWGILLIGTLIALSLIFSYFKKYKDLTFSFGSSDTPLLLEKMDLNLLVLIVTGSLIYFNLGRHDGTYMYYYYQLVTPFLIILVVENLAHYPLRYETAILLVSLNLLTFGFTVIQPDLQPYDTKSYEKLNFYLTTSKSVLNSPSTTLELINHNISVVDSGLSEYFRIPKKSNIFYPDLQQIVQVSEKYKMGIDRGIKQQSYDLILADNLNPVLETAAGSKYKKIETIEFKMAHTNQIWTVDVLVPSTTLQSSSSGQEQ